MPNDEYGVGASLLRKEDERHLHGRGQFVPDIKLPGTMVWPLSAARMPMPASDRSRFRPSYAATCLLQPICCASNRSG